MPKEFLSDVDFKGTITENGNPADVHASVTLAGTPDYLTLSGQEITRNLIDLTTDVTGDLPISEGGTNASDAGTARTNLGLAIGTDVQAHSSVLDNTTASYTIAEQTKLSKLWGGDNKLDATTAPGANDDAANTSGNGTFSVGSVWANVTADETYRCVDSTATAAVWVNTSLEAGDLSNLAVSGDSADLTDTGDLLTFNADFTDEDGVKSLTVPNNTTISAFGATLVDDADAATARTTLGVDAAGADNSTDVTLAGTPDYITIVGQEITRNQIDLTTDVTGDLPVLEGGTGASDAATARTNLGLAIGTDVQAYDAELAALAGTTSAADALPYYTGVGTATTATLTTFGRSLIDDVDASTARTTLGVAIGTDVQAYDADLNTIAGLTPSPNDVLLYNGSGWTADPHIADFFSGTFVEEFDSVATSDGGTVTASLEKKGTGDLTMRFSDGLTTLDCTPAATITLTAGTDAAPTNNYVYIPQSTKVLTLSTSDWPADEHIRVSYFLVPSAGFVQTNGCYITQNWNDASSDANGQGHLTHITERIRAIGAGYSSGIAGNGTEGYLTPTASNVEFKSTAGEVFQLHTHSVPAFDTSTGDIMLVKNWSGDPYHDLTNLFDITADSTGTTITNNRYFNLVVWGVGNKGGEFSPFVINLPGGFYNAETDALADSSSYDDYAIPAQFQTESSTGFLICRITVQMGATWSVSATQDLRGTRPQYVSGGGSGAQVEFSDDQFRVLDGTDPTKELAFELSGVTAATTRTLTVPDESGTIALTANVLLADGSNNLTGDITFADGVDIVVNATTGTQIATATTQKLGFYGVTPVDQPAVTEDLLDALQSLGFVASGAGNTPLNLTDGAFECGTVTCGAITIDDAADVVLNTTTGTKIGTAVGQKLGFWNATPIVQPASANQAALTNSTGGSGDGTLAAVTDTSLSDQSGAINDNFTELHVLLDEIRTALVNSGIIKGAA